MNRKDYYNAAYIAIFGGLWGATEILLGNILHLLDIPFTGNVLSAIGCMICLVSTFVMPNKSKTAIISIGLIAAIIRTFSFGAFKVHILVSIVTEALLIQLIINIFRINRFSFSVAGILAWLSPYISGALFFGIVLGQGSLFMIHGIIAQNKIFKMIMQNSLAIAAIFFALSIIMGIATGLFAYQLGKKFHHATDS